MKFVVSIVLTLLIFIVNVSATEQKYPCHVVCLSKRVMPFSNEKECNCGEGFRNEPRKPVIRERRAAACMYSSCVRSCISRGYTDGECTSVLSNTCLCYNHIKTLH